MREGFTFSGYVEKDKEGYYTAICVQTNTSATAISERRAVASLLLKVSDNLMTEEDK